ncbi:IS5 family transposase [Mesorhizobium sp. M0938]|uniref:IS5 family transposase n=1 Tax=unclassified Mesorhizobium TaxID=325217 RepID=UPI00333C4CD3
MSGAQRCHERRTRLRSPGAECAEAVNAGLGDLCAGGWTGALICDSLDLIKGLRDAMSLRGIGQEKFGFAVDGGRHSSLDELARQIDWASIERHLAVISCAAKGEPAWPPTALFKAMLLSIWYDLSDVKLAEALDDRGSFRRFCGFSAWEPTPERTAFVRFRKALVAHGLDRTLFDEITRQLKAKAIRVKTGTLVDATIIASANEDDDEDHWVKHKGRPAVHGFKAHVGADADTALVEEIAITPANINDGKAGADALLDDPGEVFADSAYRGNHFGDAVRAKGGTPRVVATGMWGRDEAEIWAHLEARTNRSTAFVVASRKSSAHGRVFADGESLPGRRSNSPHCHRLQYET